MGEDRKAYGYRDVISTVQRELVLLKNWGLDDLVRVEKDNSRRAKKRTMWSVAEKCQLWVEWDMRYGVSLHMELRAPPYEFKTLPSYMLDEPNITSFVRKFLERVVIYLTHNLTNLPCRARGVLVGENALAEFTLGKRVWAWKFRVNGRSIIATKSPLSENPISPFIDSLCKVVGLLFL